MGDFLNVSGYFLCALIIGVITLKLVSPDFKLNLKGISMAYGLGLGAISLEMLFISLAGYRFSLGLILLPWCLLLMAVVYRSRKEIKKGLAFKNSIDSANVMVFLFFLLAVSPFFLEILAGLPFSGWDAWASFGLKAKIFYLERHVPLELYADKFSIIPVKEYPLMVSLTEVFYYNFLGRFDDSWAKVIFFSFYVSFLVYFYILFKELYDRLRGALFTFLLATTPIFVSFASGYYNGYADLIFTYFNFISATLLWQWTLKKELRLFYLSSIFAGLALWTKVDGVALLSANAICLLLFGFPGIKNTLAKTRLFFIYALIPLIIAGPWYVTVALMRFSSVHIRVDQIYQLLFADFKRLPTLGIRFLGETLSFLTWNVFWLTFILLILSGFRKLFKRTNKFISLNLLLQLGLYAFIMAIDIEFYSAIWNSMSRLMLHLLPLILILISSVMFQKESDSPVFH